MWQAETKRLIVDKVWLGSGSTNSSTGVTINTSAGITLVEGIRIKADASNNDAVLIYSTSSQGGGGNYPLNAGEEVFLPISTPNTINIAAEANTVNYSFVAW